ncbi:MAG: hypothetical protein JW874_11180 [Spirochaetales bacterium]|nr:hypothetical protein [Spirochaetales bacterium]
MKKILTVLFLVLIMTSCSDVKQKLLKAMQDLEIQEYEDTPTSEEKIEKLKEEIEKQQQIVDAKVQAGMQISIHFKMLTLEYIFLNMYGPALTSVVKAIEIDPTNYKLLYLAGVCSAQLGKATGPINRRNEYFLDAEYYYLRALDLREDYEDALYGLGVLYGFEMERYFSAKEYLEKLIKIKPKREDARFALAHVYAALGWIKEAGDQFDEIITTSSDKEKIREAGELKGELMGTMNVTE